MRPGYCFFAGDSPVHWSKTTCNPINGDGRQLFVGEAVMRGLGADVERVTDLFPCQPVTLTSQPDLMSSEHFEGFLGLDSQHG